MALECARDGANPRLERLDAGACQRLKLAALGSLPLGAAAMGRTVQRLDARAIVGVATIGDAAETPNRERARQERDRDRAAVEAPEGSITQRADGRWQGTVDLGWRAGKRVRKFVYARTRQAVATRLRKALDQADQGIPFADERQTVGQYLHSWLALKQGQLRPRTFASYEQAVRVHIAPGPIAKVSLAKLTPQQLSAWFHEHKASARTIRYIRAVLRAALNQALRWGIVSRNAAALVEVPRHRTREIHPLTPDQTRTLLASVADHRLGAIVSVASALGLRMGEALGLRWQDVDFDAGTLAIRQALERSGGDSAARRPLVVERRQLLTRFKATAKRSAARREVRQQLDALRATWRDTRTTIRFVEPKSSRSRRTIRMPGIVVSALKAHRRRQLEERLAAGSAWEDSGPVFTTPLGTAVDPRNVTREFRAMLTAAKLPAIRFHDLRHTAATLLLAQGVDPRTIMETLGHSQISLMLNTYSHVLPALQAEAAAKLDAILKR